MIDEDLKTNYPYIGVPLQPQIIADIARRLSAGSVAKTQDIAAKCAAFHDSHGGVLTGADLKDQSKRALNILESGASAQSVTKGLYRFSGVEDAAP